MIRLARKRLNLTQKELALRCNTSQSYISKLETKSNKNIPLLKLQRISKVLKLDLHEFIDWLLY